MLLVLSVGIAPSTSHTPIPQLIPEYALLSCVFGVLSLNVTVVVGIGVGVGVGVGLGDGEGDGLGVGDGVGDGSACFNAIRNGERLVV